jgi:hypothetical protein
VACGKFGVEAVMADLAALWGSRSLSASTLDCVADN